MTTASTQRLSPAEQAKALLADAANKDRFYENSSICDELPRFALRERDAATALYAAQAATAQALLAVVGELAELRAEVRQAAAVREDLAGIAVAVRELTAAMSPVTTIAEGVDGLTDEVEAVRAAVEDGLADVANVVELLARPRGGWWSRLWRPVRRRRSQALPAVADVRARLIAAAAPPNWLGDTLTRAAELLDREGWDPAGIIGRDVMTAVSKVTMSSPRSPYDEGLCTHVWDTVVAHLDGQPLAEWQREPSRTQGQVVAMLREVAAKVTVSELPVGEGGR